MINISQQIPDEEFLNSPTDETADKISKILKELKYDSVIWLGSVYMLPNTFMGWDTEFKIGNEYDNHREFLLNSPTKNKMEQIIEILLIERIEYNWEFFS